MKWRSKIQGISVELKRLQEFAKKCQILPERSSLGKKSARSTLTGSKNYEKATKVVLRKA